MSLSDSGKRREFGTGAVRDVSTGKGRMDLLQMRALIEISKVLEAGASKYAARNWEQGIKLSSYIDSGLRHLARFLKGDSDEPHLAQACWNLLCCLDTGVRISEGILPKELNDLPTELHNIPWTLDSPKCHHTVTSDGNCLYCGKPLKEIVNE